MATRARATLVDAQASPVRAATARLKVETVLIELPLLNLQDLNIIQAALDIELLKRRPIDTELYFLVFEVVGEKPIPPAKFALSNNGLIWRRNEPAFKDLVSKIVGDSSLSRLVMLALYRMLIQLIVEDIKSNFQQVTLKSICEHLGKAEAAFDRAFPGYLQNGMSHVILRQLGGGL